MQSGSPVSARDTTQPGSTPSSERPKLDRLLRMPPDIHAAWEAENSGRRLRHIRFQIVFGLIFYNLYSMTSIVLMPDIFWPTVALRSGVATPLTLLLGATLILFAPQTRERLVLSALMGAFALPIFLFWWTDAPQAGYSLGELTLINVFAAVLMSMNFRYCMIYCAVTVTLWVGVVLLKPGIPADLQFAFIAHAVTSTVFCLAANYIMDRRRCVDYLNRAFETRRAETAEAMSRELTHLTKTDDLTGLPNRRFLDEHLDRWLASAPPVSVLMIDLDDFKKYNDTLGHPAGDDCLRRVAAILREIEALPDHIIARVGGEEFTVALRGVDEDRAIEIGNGLVAAVSGSAMAHPGREDGIKVVTISAGLASKPRGTFTSPRDLVSRADEALYVAKARGRNRLVAAGGPRGKPVSLSA